MGHFNGLNARVKNGIPLIHMVCRMGSMELLFRILNEDNLEMTDAQGLTPLLVLCGEYIPIECIQYALDLGANVYATDNVSF